MREERSPYYRWIVLATVSLASTALSAVQIGLPAIGPVIAEAYGLSLAGVGWALGSVSLGMVCTLLLWGRLLDRRGDRWPLAVGMAGAALALAGAAIFDTLVPVLFALVLAGMAGSVAAVGGGQAILSWFDHGERGFALGIRQMTVPVGGAVGAAALPRVAASGGMTAVLAGLSGFCALAALASAILMRSHGPHSPPRLVKPHPSSQAADPRARRLGLA
ncbi:MAG TPA: MFS transporter, partial [Solirubrobacterales bacterium]